MGKPINIKEPEKELRFTRSRQAITFVVAGFSSLCIIGFLWFKVYFNVLETAQTGSLVFPILISIALLILGTLFFWVAIHCTQHAMIILSPLGLELFPFWFPVKNFRMLYWSEIDNAKISQNMKLLTIDCNNGSKLFISLTPISFSHRQYLKVAIDGRLQAKSESK